MSGGLSELERRIESGVAVVGVMGLGYVGLPLAMSFCEGVGGAGCGVGRVIGFDVDEEKVGMLGRGEAYLPHLGEERHRALVSCGRFEATADFGRLGEADAVVVCLPTPLGVHREPDLGFVVRAGEMIGGCLRGGQLVVLESTTYPGTTRGEFLRAIERGMAAGGGGGGGGFVLGEDWGLAFSPEREDPGNARHRTGTIPKLVGGVDERSGRMAAALYRRAVAEVVEVGSAEVAEAAKLLENIFRAVNIALVNEMKVVLTEMGVDVWEVIRAAGTKPFGFMPFYPGPGLGGHCIPVDPFYLSWKAREVGVATKFIELAGEVNSAMPGWVVDRVVFGLNEAGKAVRGSRVLVLGLAYKRDVADDRESPAFEIIERLRGMGAEVSYSDPHIARTKRRRAGDLGMESVELTEGLVGASDAVVVVTDHSSFDWELIGRSAELIVDARGVFAAGGYGARGRVIGA